MGNVYKYSFEKYWDSDEALAYRHDDTETQARRAYIAGLSHAVEKLRYAATLAQSKEVSNALCGNAYALECETKSIEGEDKS